MSCSQTSAAYEFANCCAAALPVRLVYFLELLLDQLGMNEPTAKVRQPRIGRDSSECLKKPLPACCIAASCLRSGARSLRLSMGQETA